MFSRRIKWSASGFFFLLTAVLSICGYVFEILKELMPSDINRTILVVINLFTIVKDMFSSNPLIFSLFFVGLAVLDDLYYAFKYDKLQNDLSVRIGKYVKYFLAVLNIICCVNLLDAEGLERKLNWVQQNKKQAILIVVGVVAYIIVMELLKKGILAKHEQKEIHQEIQNHSKEIDATNPPKSIIQHPFAYAYEQVKIDIAKKIIDDVTTSSSSQNQPTNGQSANSKPEQSQRKELSKHISLFLGGILFLIITVVLIILIGWGIRTLINDDGALGKAQEFIKEFLRAFSCINTNMDSIEAAALTFLLSIGGIIAVVLIFFVLIYGMTFVIRAWIYMLMHITDDESDLGDFYKDIRKFFSGSIKSVLRLLLFVPDFLETVEKTILDSDELD